MAGGALERLRLLSWVGNCYEIALVCRCRDGACPLLCRRDGFGRTRDGRRPGDGTPNPFGMVTLEHGLLHDLHEPVSLPAWLAKADFDAYAAAFARSGFRGGLSDYRNLDRNW